MYEQMKLLIAGLLTKARPLKAQTERQILQYLQEHGGDTASFFLRAAVLLEEHELEILFAPQFTPSLDDQAAFSEILANWQPTPADLERLVADLCGPDKFALVQLADTSEARLPLHQVMVERFVRLLRLNHAPQISAVVVLQDALPSELYVIAAALIRQRGFTPERQAWFAAFVRHLARQHTVTTCLLVVLAQFVVDQPTFDSTKVLAAARELAKAAKGGVAYAQAGRMYWSPDVAQHHQFRGQGHLNQALIKQRLEELASLETVEKALQAFVI